MGDQLFPVYNNFFIGAFQVAINEASDLQGLSDTEATERDCYMYRSYIALGSYQVSESGRTKTRRDGGVREWGTRFFVPGGDRGRVSHVVATVQWATVL